jgi:hypothetical protein
MTRSRLLLAVAVAFSWFVPAARAQEPSGEKWTEPHFLLCRLDGIRSRTPSEVVEELQARIQRYEGLAWEGRQEVEKILCALESMLPHQIQEVFKDALAAGDDKNAKVKDALKKLAEGGEIPAPNIQPSAVVVIVGGSVESRGGLPDLQQEMPLLWNEIRPFGAMVRTIKTMWVSDRIKWLGEFLTGTSIGVVIDGNVVKFRSPTVCDLFRKASGADARDCWIATLGDENMNIILDFQEFEKDFQDKFKPTALNEYKLKSIDGYVQDQVLSLRKEGKTPFEIQNLLPEVLNPSKLHIDIDFDDTSIQKFVTRIVAEHGGQITVSEAFLQRLGVRLLQDPVMAPRLAIFRFGGIPELRDEKRMEVRRSLMAKRSRDHDAAVYSLWRAFRSNPYYKTMGTFVVLHETSGAIFCGPKIKVGADASKSYYLYQMLPTLAKILGYEPDAFVAPCKNPPRKPVIDEIFE